MDPEFKFAAYYGQFMTSQEMADGIIKTTAAYEPPSELGSEP